LWRSLPEGRARRGGNGRAFLLGRSAPPAKIEVEDFLAAGHRPAVIGAEDRPEDERPVPEQGLIGPDAPIVLDVHELSHRLEGPHASADEVAIGNEREAVDATRFGGLEPPSQRVRKPSLRVGVDYAADTGDGVSGA